MKEDVKTFELEYLEALQTLIAKICGVPLSVVCDYYGFNKEWLEEYFLKGEES